MTQFSRDPVSGMTDASRVSAGSGGDGTCPPRDSRSLGDLIKELRNEAATLFRQEIQLAKTEISEKLSTYARNLAYVAVAGVLAVMGLAFLLLTLTMLLYVALAAMGVPRGVAGWLSTLIMAVVFLGVAGGLAFKAYKTITTESPVPTRTVRSLQENKQWLKEKIS